TRDSSAVRIRQRSLWCSWELSGLGRAGTRAAFQPRGHRSLDEGGESRPRPLRSRPRFRRGLVPPAYKLTPADVSDKDLSATLRLLIPEHEPVNASMGSWKVRRATFRNQTDRCSAC